ncbi:MAG: CDP-alcohol phosphatidyltransferase family protein [Verrucomicrobia bacterium]|nr:CDP-alcohol phosphatidyltransferase family protein [Verrucomicrobiota bacterium]
MNLPLYLTLSRVFFGPIFIAIYLYYQEMGISLLCLPYILIFLALISELSDLFDGFLARKYNKVTELGKILDPMADSVFRFSVLLAFTQGIIHLPVLLVAVFFYRDSIISTLRTICALRGFTLAARKSGKIKAVILATISFFILLLMIPYSLGALSQNTLRLLSLWSVSLTAIYVVYTGYEYIYANRLHIKKALGF